MMTPPVIKERTEVPYAAIHKRVTLPFDDQVPGILETLFTELNARKIEPVGPVFFKHNVIDMPHIDMEFGVPISELVPENGNLIIGILPAGRYGEVTHYGPYDGVMAANSSLVGWATENAIEWDVQVEPDGEHFACRLEIYVNGPDNEPNPEKLETVVTIKLADSSR